MKIDQALLGLMVMATIACGSSAEQDAPPAAGSPAETEPAQAPEPPEPPPAAEEPTVVAERYLRGAATPDAVAPLLAADCAPDASEWQVAAARVMGAPITIAELTVDEASRDGDTAMVSYSLSGDAHGQGGTTMLFGATVQTGEVSISGATRSGTLRLRRVDGVWRIACGG